MDVFGKEYVLGALSLVPEDVQPNVDELCREFDECLKSARFCFEEGYGMYPGFSLQTGRAYQPRDGDVLVASYAKTGSTWTREVVRKILYCNDKDLFEKTKLITQLYSFISMDPPMKHQVVNNLRLPRRFMATHLPAPLLDFNQLKEKNVKIIYVVRNPKDQAVSWYNFLQKFPATKQPPLSERIPENEREFYDAYLEGESVFVQTNVRPNFKNKLCTRVGTVFNLNQLDQKQIGVSRSGQQCFMAKEGEGYLEHIRDWWEHVSNDENVMLLVYEEMKKNFPREVRRLAEFIGVELSDDDVRFIVGASDVNEMKKNSISTEVSNLFIRKGEVGNWKNHLTVAQSEYVDQQIERVIGHTGIKFIYEL